MGRGTSTVSSQASASGQRSQRSQICNCRIGNPTRWIGEGLGETGLVVVKNTSDCQVHGADVKAKIICYACGSKLLTPPPPAGLCGNCENQRYLDEGKWEALGAGAR